MADITTALSIAKSALLSTQKAVSVVSHNIANANNEGYTRQRAVFEPMEATEYGGLLYGRGVKIADVERIYDRYLDVALRDAKSGYEYFNSKSSVLQNIEGILNDLDETTGLSAALDGLFNSFQDLSSDPSSSSERVSLLSSAAVLVDAFNNVDSRIRHNLSSIEEELEGLVDRVNQLAQSIADINNEISFIEAKNLNPNDLLDERDKFLSELAEIVDISTYQDERGEVSVLIGSGVKLVAGTDVTEISLVAPDLTSGTYKILSGDVDLTDRLTGGKIKGLVEGRDQIVDTLDDLNLLAASLIKEVNIQHRAGYGLDSSTGNDFFSGLQVTGSADDANTGGAQVSSTAITDLSALTLNDYEVRFSSSTTYTVVNVDTGQVVIAGGTYTSGSAITFDGMSVTISDVTSSPATGDVFSVSATKDTARNIDVAVTDTDKVAAATDSAALPGDNRNALALAALKDSKIINNGTFNDFYNGILTEVGVASNTASLNTESQQTYLQQLEVNRESTSGVSLEEEAVELIKLQRSFEAAARVLTVADEMFRTLLDIK